MAKFIKLHRDGDKPIYINAEFVALLLRSDGDTVTWIQFADDDIFEDVTETPEQIFALIEADRG